MLGSYRVVELSYGMKNVTEVAVNCGGGVPAPARERRAPPLRDWRRARQQAAGTHPRTRASDMCRTVVQVHVLCKCVVLCARAAAEPLLLRAFVRHRRPRPCALPRDGLEVLHHISMAPTEESKTVPLLCINLH